MWKFTQTKLVSISIKPGRCGYRDDRKTGSIPPGNERKIQEKNDATRQMSIMYAKTSTFTKKKKQSCEASGSKYNKIILFQLINTSFKIHKNNT